MKESAPQHHKPPLRSAVHPAEIMTDRDKVTALMNKQVTHGDTATGPMSKPGAMKTMAMDLLTRSGITTDMGRARRNTADMGDMADIDMDGVVDRHIIRG